MSNTTISYPYLQGGAYDNAQIETYVNELVRKHTTDELQRKLKTAIHNPVTGWIHLEDPTYNANEHIPWTNYPRVIDTKRYHDLVTRNASGQRHANDDQATYNFYSPEWQDEALRCNEFIDTHGAGVITSTDFPAITVTTISNELLRNDLVVTQKYNLLGITTTINTDQLQVIYPEYNDTGKKVRGGYKENDPIDTTGPGAFTETRIGLEKSGVGVAFTEEFYQRQFTYPITQFLLEAIANDFARVKHERLVALLPSFADVTGADWAAFTGAISTNRPVLDLNAARTAVNSDKLGRADTICSKEQHWIDYDINTWTKGSGQSSVPQTASNRDPNDVIARPQGIPWAEKWILNEDLLADKVYVFDKRAFVFIQGPRKTTQFQLYNPDQTVTIQKDWFKQHLRKAVWGREITGV